MVLQAVKAEEKPAVNIGSVAQSASESPRPCGRPAGDTAAAATPDRRPRRERGGMGSPWWVSPTAEDGVQGSHRLGGVKSEDTRGVEGRSGRKRARRGMQTAADTDIR